MARPNQTAIALGVMCLFAVSASEAAAQVRPVGRPGPALGYTKPPAFSPYLNLLRRGNPTVLNYYGLVRPELEFRSNVQDLQQQVTANRQGLSQLASDPTTGGLPTTGHTAMFLNTGGYFMNMSGVGGGQMTTPGGGVRGAGQGPPAPPSRGGGAPRR